MEKIGCMGLCGFTENNRRNYADRIITFIIFVGSERLSNGIKKATRDNLIPGS